MARQKLHSRDCGRECSCADSYDARWTFPPGPNNSLLYENNGARLFTAKRFPGMRKKKLRVALFRLWSALSSARKVMVRICVANGEPLQPAIAVCSMLPEIKCAW